MKPFDRSSVLLLILALTCSGATWGDSVDVTVTGTVVLKATNEPLGGCEVELSVLKLPSWLMPSYVKLTSAVTDRSGNFSISAKVPGTRKFLLETRNVRTPLGGGIVKLDPRMPVPHVTIVHDFIGNPPGQAATQADMSPSIPKCR